MGASRLKPVTTKEIEKLTSTKPDTIKHRSLGGVPGFVMVHTPSGYTSFGLIYRAKGQRRKLTLGSTKSLSLGEARKLAGQLRAKIEAGGDPHGEKLEQRRLVDAEKQQEIEEQQLRVEVLWEKYMVQVGSRLRSKDEKDRVFRRNILPTISGLSVKCVTRRHALAVIDALVDRDKRRMADKVRQEGAAFFQWLLEREHVDRNVFAGVRKACTTKSIRTRVLSDDELKAIWIACEPEGRWACWVRLLILTGCRNMEVRGARWSEFDFRSRTWVIPAERSKNGRPHTIFLTSTMVAVIKKVPRFKGVDFVFPAVGNACQPMSGDQKVKDRIAKRVNLARFQEGLAEFENWCVHDFRRTIATGLQRLGYRPDIADQVIGHVGSTRMGAAAHYLHHRYEAERKDALRTWTKHIAKVLCNEV